MHDESQRCIMSRGRLAHTVFEGDCHVCLSATSLSPAQGSWAYVVRVVCASTRCVVARPLVRRVGRGGVRGVGGVRMTSASASA
jgi:hypothetical protein